MEDPLAATQGLAPADRAAARKAAGNAAATMLTFFVGVLFGAAWPSAVAGCGLPVMGAVIGFLQLRRA